MPSAPTSKLLLQIPKTNYKQYLLRNYTRYVRDINAYPKARRCEYNTNKRLGILELFIRCVTIVLRDVSSIRLNNIKNAAPTSRRVSFILIRHLDKYLYYLYSRHLY